MATVESPQEMMDRVKGMAEGDPTWDLSDNDRLALAALIRRVERLENFLQARLRRHFSHREDPNECDCIQCIAIREVLKEETDSVG